MKNQKKGVIYIDKRLVQDSGTYCWEDVHERIKSFLEIDELERICEFEYLYEEKSVDNTLNKVVMMELLHEIEKGHYKILIVDDIRHIANNIKDLNEVVKTIKKHKVRLISIKNKIDSNYSYGEIFLDFVSVVVSLNDHEAHTHNC
ncbi:recombinase family protein [Erysipelothrix aquatica]|uniref:recombinase family protein n=1 Tax=Erysipelothrix aquatica TaxID=2683714 RepID=UPI001356DEB9|nr:recombinase family protein [Erysipelothrix aquatica]